MENLLSASFIMATYPHLVRLDDYDPKLDFADVDHDLAPPQWPALATPRAWVGEPHKLPSVDRRAPFFPDPYLAEYLHDPAPPPPAFAPAPALAAPDDYYPPFRYHHTPACDPRFVSPAPASPAVISFADVYRDPVKLEPDNPAPAFDSDSGEDEKSEEDDPSYVVSPARSVRSRSAAASASTSAPRPTRTPAPEPVPNLTKKSRGRRVPTADSLYDGAAAYMANGKNARTYVCKVRDCGKCFARSEHLKRHVRSIHTNEKPHRCPHPGCNKEFSRHDNLCQHMRVHRNYSAPKDAPFAVY